MDKGLILQLREPPYKPGFLDTLLVGSNAHFVWGAPCRGGPNWRTPRRPPLFRSYPWSTKYDWIAPTKPGESYRFKVVMHRRKYGKAILINEGGEVPSQNPVRNVDDSVFVGVFIHEAQCPPWNPLWPGSAGCITLEHNHWLSFQDMWRVGEEGILAVEDYVGR